MAYATLNDLCCKVSDEGLAIKLLERASRLIDAACGDDAANPLIAADVCAAMVERALVPMCSDLLGATQATMSVASISQSVTYSNPSGDLYMTQTEREALGIGGKIGFANPFGGDAM
ncbi:MAG: Gp19/Gp15/Gp42 family protein [Eggerthellaceae bacterium]